MPAFLCLLGTTKEKRKMYIIINNETHQAMTTTIKDYSEAVAMLENYAVLYDVSLYKLTK